MGSFKFKEQRSKRALTFAPRTSPRTGSAAASGSPASPPPHLAAAPSSAASPAAAQQTSLPLALFSSHALARSVLLPLSRSRLDRSAALPGLLWSTQPHAHSLSYIVDPTGLGAARRRGEGERERGDDEETSGSNRCRCGESAWLSAAPASGGVRGILPTSLSAREYPSPPKRNLCWIAFCFFLPKEFWGR